MTLKDGERIPFSFLSLFLGAQPCAEWLGDTVARDEDGFILTGSTVGSDDPLETSVSGVYAAGDVARGLKAKRCAAGGLARGAMVVQLVDGHVRRQREGELSGRGRPGACGSPDWSC